MKTLLLFVILSFFNCEYFNIRSTNPLNTRKSECNHVEEFKKFASLIKIESGELSNYLNFPFEDNNIWHLVNLNSEEEYYDFNSSFKESDFIKNVSSVFPLELYKIIELSKVSFFFNEQTYQSKKITGEEGVDNYFSVRSFVNFNKENEKLMFNLLYEYLDDGDIYETSVNYIFVFKNCRIELIKIVVAG